MIDNFDIIRLESIEGLTFTKVCRNEDDESIEFWVGNTLTFKMYHDQDCCESVYIESIVGDLSDLENTPILEASESSDQNSTDDGSSTWTFYKFRTLKGYVDIRWMGESNGYYSERVSLVYWPDTGEEY